MICDSEKSCKKIMDFFGGKVVGTIPVGGKTFYKIMVEKINEQYDILASGISDERTAEDLARSKNGVKIQDPDQKDKWIVISKEEKP